MDARGARRARLRHRRHLPALAPHGRPGPRDGRLERQPDAAASTSAGWPGTTSSCGILEVPRAVLPEVRSSSEVVRRDRRRHLRRGDPDRRHSPATSRRRRSGRPASRRARPRTPTGPARSCCSNTGTEPRRLGQRPADDGRLAARAGGAGDLRAGGLGLRRRRRRPVAARRPAGHRALGRRRARWRRGVDGHRRRLSRAGVRRASARRTGIPTRAGTIVGPHPGHGPAPRSPGRRSTRSPTRSPTCSRRWPPTPACRSSALRVDGGAAANDALLQFQADLLGRPGRAAGRGRDDGARGGAALAGLAVGFWESPAEIASIWAVDRRFEPSMAAARRAELLRGWHRAVERSRDWADPTDPGPSWRSGPLGVRSEAPSARLRRVHAPYVKSTPVQGLTLAV